VRWGFLVPAVLAASFGIYLLVRAQALAANERDFLFSGPGYERIRTWSHRVAGVFMIVVAIACLVTVFRTAP
jgi:hypothetical protein